MKFHIVKSGEKVRDLLFIYNLNIDELKENNRHIKFWDKLIPGTKIKIPVITEAINNDVEMMEPFIEDYYPKQLFDLPKENDSNSFVTEEVVLEKEESSVETESSKEEIEKDNKETVKEEKIQTVKQNDKISYKQANMNVVNVLCYHPYYGYVIVPYVYKM